MYDKFLALNEEKQSRILNAAMEEFAQKGYKNASTNEITQKAGISKGLLFHYFGSKKNFFLFLYDYDCQIVMEEFYGKINFDEKDLIKRFLQIGLLKMDIVNKHPDLYQFMLTAYTETDPEVQGQLKERKTWIISDAFGKIFTGYDQSKFKPGLDPEIVTNVIIWVLQGMGDREYEHLKTIPGYRIDYEKLIPEYNRYIEFLQNLLYQ